MDDILSTVARRGLSQEIYLEDLQWNMCTWGGGTAVNWEKANESDGFIFYQPGFGKTVGYCRRNIFAARTCSCRGEDSVRSYLNDKAAKFTSLEVPSTAGTLRSIFETAGGLKGLITSRFDSMLGDMAQHDPIYQDKSYVPSAAATGETQEEADGMMRISLEVGWRLATIGGGKYIGRSCEVLGTSHDRHVHG